MEGAQPWGRAGGPGYHGRDRTSIWDGYREGGSAFLPAARAAEALHEQKAHVWMPQHLAVLFNTRC